MPLRPTTLAEDIEAMPGLLRLLFDIEADFEFDEARQRRELFLMTDGCLKHKVIQVAESAGRIVDMASAQTLISSAEGALSALVEDVVVLPLPATERGEAPGAKLVRKGRNAGRGPVNPHRCHTSGFSGAGCSYQCPAPGRWPGVSSDSDPRPVG